MGGDCDGGSVRGAGRGGFPYPRVEFRNRKSRTASPVLPAYDGTCHDPAVEKITKKEIYDLIREK